MARGPRFSQDLPAFSATRRIFRNNFIGDFMAAGEAKLVEPATVMDN